MCTTGDEMMKLLLEIVMDLYRENMRQRDGGFMDEEPSRSVFLGIRSVQDEETTDHSYLASVVGLQRFDMSNLCELLGLSAIYAVTPLTAGKVGYFLTNLCVLREDASFDVQKWMQTSLMTAAMRFPGIVSPEPAPVERAHRPACSCRH